MLRVRRVKSDKLLILLKTLLLADSQHSKERVQKEKRDKTPEQGRKDKQKKSVKSSLPHALSDKLENVMREKEHASPPPPKKNINKIDFFFHERRRVGIQQ